MLDQVDLLMTRKSRNKEDYEGNIWHFLAGLAMGFVGYGILSEIARPKPKCPVCATELRYGQQSCFVCKNHFRWD